MRNARTAGFVMSVLILAAAVLTGPAASADSVQNRLAKARQDKESARAAVDSAKSDLDRLLAEYAAVQARLQQAAIDVVGAYGQQETLGAELEGAQDALDRRAADAYEAGPAVALELFLGSASAYDFASAQEYVSRILVVDQGTVDRVTAARGALDNLTALRRERQADLAADVERLEQLSAAATASLAAARTQAGAAGVTVKKLEAEEAALLAAQAAVDASLFGLVDPGRGRDQSELLAMLGPNQGKGCDIPETLTDTGERLAGQSSWYGWDFAGQRTASGAIFDPRLFTVANKELPLNVFVRLHYNGKCAIGLVNDRGPYGVSGRIFDASEAIAEYLGFKGAGVAQVTADVLVPAS